MQKNELQKKLDTLAARYLDPHLVKASLTEEEEDDIRAFCVLSHAALEEFLESFASKHREKLIERWSTASSLRKAAVVGLISLLVTSGKSTFKIEIEGEESNTQVAPLHQIRSRLTDSHQAHKLRVDKNHGASKSYIRDMLVPLGFGDVSDHGVMDAIGKLANNRGSYAHRVNPTTSSQFVLNKMSASQLKALIPDIVRLHDELVRQAKEALPTEYPPFQFEASEI